MCTALTFKGKEHYFGRNLDWEHSYGEKITITPKNFPITFKEKETINSHYAIIGMAMIYDNYPFYFDASNEKGLSCASLNFVGSAKYFDSKSECDNISFYEVILWILSQCENVQEAKMLLKKINITNTQYDKTLPVSELHWIIADANSSITLESTKDGIKVYENKVGILTNNPAFDMQLVNLSFYCHLSNKNTENNSNTITCNYNNIHGLKAFGLPGDWSSPSRFVRAHFLKKNSPKILDEYSSVNHFFDILSSVSHPLGCMRMLESKYEITQYSSCINTTQGIYYYKTYQNRNIVSVSLFSNNLEKDELITYELQKNQIINNELSEQKL